MLQKNASKDALSSSDATRIAVLLEAAKMRASTLSDRCATHGDDLDLTRSWVQKFIGFEERMARPPRGTPKVQVAVKPKVPRVKTQAQVHERQQKAHEKGFHELFRKLGFTHVETDGTQVTYQGRNGELDGIFVFENVVLVVEYTVGKPDSGHLLKKKVLYDLILDDAEKFLTYAEAVFPNLKTAINPLYPKAACRIKILYASKFDPSDELMNACPEFKFIHGATAKYFQALVGTIEKSARIEFLKFLGFNHDEVGEQALSNSYTLLTYEGFLLPDGSSHYPSGYKVVSFYADPERLIARSYVLRRDGWREESHLYQRILIAKKIKEMRRYLVTEKRVFVNNIIVTLPPETKLNARSTGKSGSRVDSSRVQAVDVQIPDGYDTIGLVDGQHRVFCYHEGSDRAEQEIKILRKRQNLMVTGIVYPEGTGLAERRAFEAKLFLEINDNQARARSALKHDIEVILKPYSSTAIAKRVIQELGRRGPYKNMLQASFFDSPTKIKVSSIVSYGLVYIVKLEGADSLFTAWGNEKKDKLKGARPGVEGELLEEYIKFCVDKINEFFVEVKLAYGPQVWDLDTTPRSPLLSPTAINGQIVCLRKIIESGQALSSSEHKKKLQNIAQFEFLRFKSSQWQRLGTLLYQDHYRSDSTQLSRPTEARDG